jgi:acyl-CoA thioesterase-1
MESELFMLQKTIQQLALVVTVLLMAMASASAEAIKIVALGASNTNGKGVGSGQAWPAQLEGLLRAKGYDVSVSVNAVNGNRSDQILARAASAASGARVVAFETGQSNDKDQGLPVSTTTANIAKIRAQIQSQGAVPVTVMVAQTLPAQQRQADGVHATPQGHAVIAARIAPQVMAAIGKRK